MKENNSYEKSMLSRLAGINLFSLALQSKCDNCGDGWRPVF